MQLLEACNEVSGSEAAIDKGDNNATKSNVEDLAKPNEEGQHDTANMPDKSQESDRSQHQQMKAEETEEPGPEKSKELE